MHRVMNDICFCDDSLHGSSQPEINRNFIILSMNLLLFH